MADAPDVQQDDSPSEEFLNTPLVEANNDQVIETEDTPEDKGSDDTTKSEEPETKEGDAKSTEAKEEPKEGEEKPTEEPQPAEAPEKDNKPDPELAKQRYMDSQRAKQNITRTIDDNYAPKTAEDLMQEELDKGMELSPEQAEIKAMRQEMQFERERGQITELNATLQTEAVNVEADFPVFNPKSDTYDEDFTKLVEDAYQDSANLKFDDNGIVLHAGKPLYDFYQKMANIHSRGAAKDSEKRQSEAVQMAARIESVGGSSSTSSNRDSSEEFLEKYGNMPIV
jgi:hypothetical protein